MPNDVQSIFELGSKLRGLQKLAGGRVSEREIADGTGISRNTYRDNVEKNQMSRANQQKFARKYSFSVDWPEWHDPNATEGTCPESRRDTAAAFLARVMAEKHKAACLTIEAGSTGQYLDKQFVEFRFSPADSSEPGEIVLMLSTCFSERGLELLFEETQELLTVGLRYAELQLLHRRNGASIELYPIKCLSAEGNFEADVTGLTQWWLFHTVKGDDSWMQGRRLRNNARDCVCKGLHPGDTLVAVMSARASDCVVIERRHRAKNVRSRKASRTENNRVSVPSGSFERSSEVRKQFIRQFVRLTRLGEAKAILGEQTLTVGKKP